jgi:hypothetical protein
MSEQWWNDFKTTHEWKTLTQNCSTTAADALKAGGGEEYSSWWKSHNLIWVPSDVKAFSESIKENLPFANMAGSEPAPMNGSRDMGVGHFYFEMDLQTRKDFINKLQSIKKGDSAEHVKSILGKPMYDEKIAGKETSEIKGRILIYYIKRWKKNLVNEKYDSFVSLFLTMKINLLILSQMLMFNRK